MMQIFGYRTPPKKPEPEAPPVLNQSTTPPPPQPPQYTTPSTTTSTRSNSTTAGSARPLRLVYCDERGKFKMDPEAVAALQMVKGPLGVVSVCGRARQGKSFILNQLLGRSSGFVVAPTHRPCTKGLWMWSAPLKRTAPDGSEYNLLLLDSEGIDAYDQTGTYSTQIFSLAVLLSSMFVYNQMGGIDEAALDKLSLVTEMTKHIRVRASSPSQTHSSASEIGQFSPFFLWLLRDFYLDLTEDGQRITPRDYLESALQPAPGTGKAITAKNQVRNSIRALFPERDCFTLVRPLNDEKELQKLDQIPMDKMRPEFKAGLDALTKFIFDRTRPKQLGSIVMTGPMFAGLTQSFLDAINAGAVPTIATSWQNVEENECRRAHDMAVETYSQSFNKQTPLDEVSLQEAQEEAVQAALTVYNSEAVGGGPTRQKYEKQLHSNLKRQFEDYKRKSSMEAELKCLRAVGSMDERLRNACNTPNATFDSVVKVLDGLVAEYEVTATGSSKYQKLVKFLQKSLAGSLHELVKRVSDRAAAEYSSLEIQRQSLAERVAFAGKQADAAQRDAQEWKKRYEMSIVDYRKSSENSAAQYAALQRKVTALEEKCSSLGSKFEGAKKESSDWQSKYEHLLSERQTDQERMGSEYAAIQNRCSTAEARLAAVREQAESAKEEAAEWRRKYDSIATSTKTAAEKAMAQKDRAVEQARLREDALRAEFSATLAQKDEKVKEMQATIEQGERHIAGLTARLQEHESKVSSQSEEVGILRFEIRHFQKEVEAAKSLSMTLTKDLEKAHQDKLHAEERVKDAVSRLEEAEGRCKVAERETKHAVEVAENAWNEAKLAEREKRESEHLAIERLAAVERLRREFESLQRGRGEIAQDYEQAKLAEKDALSRVMYLERRLDEREREMEQLLSTSHEQRAKTVEGFESLLASERAAKVEASQRAEALSLQLQMTQGELDVLQAQLTTVRNHETALETRVRAFSETPVGVASGGPSRTKRTRTEEGLQSSGYEMDIDINTTKKPKVESNNENGSSLVFTTGTEVDDDLAEVAKEPVTDYRKLTIAKLKQRLTEAGYGAEVLQNRNPTKKDLVSLYERLILNKPPPEPEV